MTKIAIVFTSLKYTISNSGIIFNEFKLNQIRKNNKSYSIKVTFMQHIHDVMKSLEKPVYPYWETLNGIQRI